MQTDILKEYIAQKEWIFPPAPSMRLVVDMIEWCARELPLMHPVSISGYHIREAGSTAAQELAIDPLGGSWYLEHLTDELEAQANAYFDRIEALGGVLPAIEQNFQQREIADAAFRYQSEVERGERIVVGVNRYQQADEQPVEILRIDPVLERKQIERVQGVRARRDSTAVEAALARLKADAAREGRNLMEPLVACARAYATLGETCDALRERPHPRVLPSRRLSSDINNRALQPSRHELRRPF